MPRPGYRADETLLSQTGLRLPQTESTMVVSQATKQRRAVSMNNTVNLGHSRGEAKRRGRSILM